MNWKNKIAVLFFLVIGGVLMSHKVLDWIGGNCKFPSKAGSQYFGKPVGKYLLPFQKEVITEIFDPAGKVRTPECFLYGCRKVSKSLLYSWITYYLITEKIGFEMPLVASNYSQGFILFNFIREQVLLNKKEDIFRVRKDYIEHKTQGNRVHVVFNSAEANYGGQPSGAIFDEIGNYQDARNMESIETGMSLSEDKPIILKASNPPSDKSHFVLALLKQDESDPDCYVKKFSAGIKQDWADSETWRINPFINEYFLSNGKKFKNVFDDYKKKCQVALNNKEKEISFRRLLLGQGISAKANEFIPVDKIKDFPDPDTVFKNKNLRYAVGIDLSSTRDATALSHIFYNEDSEDLFIKPFIYYPNIKNRRKSEQKRFRKWHEQGFIKIQDKKVTDKKQIVSDFKNFIDKFNLNPEAVSFDPACGASHWFEDFKDYKPNNVFYRGREMTPTIREFQRIGIAGKLHVINLNPAISWQFNNCLVSEKSKAYCLLDRATSLQSIDFPVATAIGFKHILENKKKALKGFNVFPT